MKNNNEEGRYNGNYVTREAIWRSKNGHVSLIASAIVPMNCVPGIYSRLQTSVHNIWLSVMSVSDSMQIQSNLTIPKYVDDIWEVGRRWGSFVFNFLVSRELFCNMHFLPYL